MPKKDDERQTIFALQKSKELSAEVLELCASENSFHKVRKKKVAKKKVGTCI